MYRYGPVTKSKTFLGVQSLDEPRAVPSYIVTRGAAALGGGTNEPLRPRQEARGVLLAARWSPDALGIRTNETKKLPQPPPQLWLPNVTILLLFFHRLLTSTGGGDVAGRASEGGDRHKAVRERSASRHSSKHSCGGY